MNTRRTIKWVSLAILTSFVVFVLMLLPRVRSLPEGYTYLYTPASGHRYIVAPGGIKKVGQQVLDYQVSGSVITGTVRLSLGSDDVRAFCLDLKTHKVTLGERGRSDGLSAIQDRPRHDALWRMADDAGAEVQLK